MKFRLKNRYTTPPNGYILRMRKQKTELQFWDFNSAVQAYQKVAMANPRLGLPSDANIVATIVDEQNAARVALIPGGMAYVQEIEGDPLSENVGVNPRADIKRCCGDK